MKSLRHRSSSSVLFDLWEYDPLRRLVIGRVRLGSRVVDFDVEVCRDRDPREGAFAVARRGEDAWELTAGRYGLEGGVWVARAHGVALGVTAAAYMLLCAPDDVCTELADL